MGEPAADYRARLFDLAKELHMSPSDLAKATGMPVSHVANVLNRRKHVSAMNFAKLVMAMKARADAVGRPLTLEQILELHQLAAEDPEMTARHEKRLREGDLRSEAAVARRRAASADAHHRTLRTPRRRVARGVNS